MTKLPIRTRKGDTTQARRQSRRRALIEAAAKRDGFTNGSQAVTAWMKGEYVLVKASATTKGNDDE